MPKYILTTDNNVDPMLQLPDLRGRQRATVKVCADHLNQLYELPHCVAVRALLRTVSVEQLVSGCVVIDDDVSVLRPVGNPIRVMYEAMPDPAVASSL